MRNRLSTAGLAALAVLALAAAEATAADAPAKPEIQKIPITIFPHGVLVVRGQMVEMAKLKEHLAALVPDAKKPDVEVTIYPKSQAEVALVGEITRIAKEAGYTKITYESPKPVKAKITEITILISRTGAILVDDNEVKLADLQAHLEKKVEADRRPKVRIYIRFTRLVPMKTVADVAKTCRAAGFTDIVTGIIAE
jgi:biopolymer transport protein ExbD